MLRLTVCVTRWWAGRDNAILTEPTSSHAKCLKTRRLPPVGCTTGEQRRSLSAKKQGRKGSILRSGRHLSRTKQWRLVLITIPWCTLVSGPDDPSIGGGRLGAMTPFRKLYPLRDRVCPRQMTIAPRRRFRKMVRRLFGVNWLADFSSQVLYICFLERCVRRTLRIPACLIEKELHNPTDKILRTPLTLPRT